MKLLLKIVAPLVLVANSALAADALDCAGPFGEIAEAPKLTVPAGRTEPGKDGMTCPTIPSDRIVSAVECVVRVAAPSGGAETVFRCPLGAPCPGVGTFTQIERVRGPMGLDQLCVSFVNQGERAATFGVRATLAR